LLHDGSLADHVASMTVKVASNANSNKPLISISRFQRNCRNPSGIAACFCADVWLRGIVSCSGVSQLFGARQDGLDAQFGCSGGNCGDVWLRPR
jgi:hypothetical protein